VGLRAISGGYFATNRAQFWKDNTAFYDLRGGAGGGRGFNLAWLDPVAGGVLGTMAWDTWARGKPAWEALIGTLNNLPSGMVVMLAVADEAGLNVGDGWALLDRQLYPWVEDGLQALERLGSRKLRGTPAVPNSGYCYRDSWAMIAVKAQGHTLAEELGKPVEVSASAEITVSPTATPTPTNTPGPPTATPYPRPNVGLQVTPNPANHTLQTTISARDAGCLQDNNQLHALRFTRLTNASVNALPAGTTVTAPTTVPLPNHPTAITFAVQRVTPGQPATVELVVKDGCGDWPTVVGGGPSAF
jgi:hypothetical protein